MSDDRQAGSPVFGRFALETVTKSDGRLLHLYSWPEPAETGEPSVQPATPADGGEGRLGPDSEEQSGV